MGSQQDARIGSRREGLDRFSVGPAEGAIDPLADAISRWIDIAPGAEKAGPDPLDPLTGSGTAEIRLELNQWLYFQKPGSYRVQAISRRLVKSGSERLELRSNAIKIEIVAADPEWQRRELERIRRALPTAPGPLTDPESSAVRALACLATDEALGEIKKHLTVESLPTDPAWKVAKIFLLQRTVRPKVP